MGILLFTGTQPQSELSGLQLSIIKKKNYVPQSILFAPNLTTLIKIQLLQIATWYLAYTCVTSSRTFWGVKCQGQGPFFKVKGQIEGQKRATLTLVISFHLLQIATSYLAFVLISLRWSFWRLIFQGKGHPSRSKVKLKFKAVRGT